MLGTNDFFFFFFALFHLIHRNDYFKEGNWNWLTNFPLFIWTLNQLYSNSFSFCSNVILVFVLKLRLFSYVKWFAGMIMGASASSVWYNLRVPHPTKEVPILDYDLALLFQPMLMLGITIGVTLSVVFPYWLITVLIIILFLGQLKITHSLFIFISLSYSFVERKKVVLWCTLLYVPCWQISLSVSLLFLIFMII